MKYKVLIKKCENPKRAAKIAEEIAKRSGSTPDVVMAVISEKSVCIKKDADENEAMRLKEEFEAGCTFYRNEDNELACDRKKKPKQTE